MWSQLEEMRKEVNSLLHNSFPHLRSPIIPKSKCQFVSLLQLSQQHSQHWIRGQCLPGPSPGSMAPYPPRIHPADPGPCYLQLVPATSQLVEMEAGRAKWGSLNCFDHVTNQNITSPSLRSLFWTASDIFNLVIVSHSKSSRVQKIRAGTEPPRQDTLKFSLPDILESPRGDTGALQRVNGQPGNVHQADVLPTACPFLHRKTGQQVSVSIRPYPGLGGQPGVSAHLPGYTAGLPLPVCSLFPVSSCCLLEALDRLVVDRQGWSRCQLLQAPLLSPPLPLTPPPPPPPVQAWQGKAPQG